MMIRTDRPSIIFVNRYYAPDISATSQILTDVAEGLAKKGHRILVITANKSYDGQKRFPKNDCKNGVKIRRVSTTSFGRKSIPGRVIDYLGFYFFTSILLLSIVKKNQIIIVKTDPPVLSIPLGVIVRIKQAKMVNWLQDLFPEVGFRLGVGSSSGLPGKIIKYFRNRSLRNASMNVAIGHKMLEAVASNGVPENQICVIQNFVDDESIRRSTEHSPNLRIEWGFQLTDFIVAYSGNLGRAHDLTTVLDAAESLSEIPNVKFLFVGGGYQHELLEQEQRKRGLLNLYFRPYQPRHRLNESLALPDLHWASLLPSLEGLIVPSKIYGVAAAGRPLLMIGDPTGEAGRMIQKHKFGKCVPPGEPEQVKQFILELHGKPGLARQFGINAREFIDVEGSRRIAIEKWSKLVEFP